MIVYLCTWCHMWLSTFKCFLNIETHSINRIKLLVWTYECFLLLCPNQSEDKHSSQTWWCNDYFLTCHLYHEHLMRHKTNGIEDAKVSKSPFFGPIHPPWPKCICVSVFISVKHLWLSFWVMIQIITDAVIVWARVLHYSAGWNVCADNPWPDVTLILWIQTRPY